ncbi:MAG: hypothetical protein EA342_15535 [Leptolyngbya sp. LCM1.Bin17]|nr:MAG: hypothetical protein EA342_15535 [Leptolyngbya sp. LCM1.Bin17]
MPRTLHPDDFAQRYDLHSTAATLDRVSCWTVYGRLQALNIACDCGCDRPLTIAVNTAAEAIQVWCVIQACIAAKTDLTDHLDRCWQQRSR